MGFSSARGQEQRNLGSDGGKDVESEVGATTARGCPTVVGFRELGPPYDVETFTSRQRTIQSERMDGSVGTRSSVQLWRRQSVNHQGRYGIEIMIQSL